METLLQGLGEKVAGVGKLGWVVQDTFSGRFRFSESGCRGSGLGYPVQGRRELEDTGEIPQLTELVGL